MRLTLGLGLPPGGQGQGGSGGGSGVSSPTITLSGITVVEDAETGTVIGTLSTINTPVDWGTSTYTIETGGDPDSKFDITGTDFENDDTFDFETKTSHLVTITDTPSGPYDPIERQFTITVTNVLENTLNALTLDTDEIEEGSAEDTAIGALQGVTSGSTLELTDSSGGQFKLSGSNIVAGAVPTDFDVESDPTITVRETIADATNSPRDSVIGITVTAADAVAPSIQSLSPADDATGVAVGANLVATFDEDIQFGSTVSISLFETDDTPVEAFDEGDIGTLISISGAVLTINPTADLDNSTGYYVQITSGSIEDLASNAFTGITDETTWSFTTTSGTGDEHWDNVVLLVGFDGEDAATTATDESPSAHTLTFTGATSLDTGNPKFGTAAYFVTDDDSGVEAPNSADFHFGTGQFTIEAWIFNNADIASSGTRYVLGCYDTNNQRSWVIAIGEVSSTKHFKFLYSTDGTTPTTIEANVTSVLPDLNWSATSPGAYVHIAADRDASNIFRIYCNGTMVHSEELTADFHDTTSKLRIGNISVSGGNATNAGIQGWIDEARITKGVARYASDDGFTPSSEAYPRGGL